MRLYSTLIQLRSNIQYKELCTSCNSPNNLNICRKITHCLKFNYFNPSVYPIHYYTRTLTVASPSPKGKLGTTASLSSLPACLPASRVKIKCY